MVNKKIGVYHGKFKTRKCGVCGEDDTILFCCECMRKQEEKQKEKILKVIKRFKVLALNNKLFDIGKGYNNGALYALEKLEKEMRK
jgi:hypothetical protein